jgi:hypothetical protein
MMLHSEEGDEGGRICDEHNQGGDVGYEAGQTRGVGPLRATVTCKECTEYEDMALFINSYHDYCILVRHNLKFSQRHVYGS